MGLSHERQTGRLGDCTLSPGPRGRGKKEGRVAGGREREGRKEGKRITITIFRDKHTHTPHTCTHARTHAHTHARMHTHTHACTHARTHAHMHTHTHTHLCLLIQEHDTPVTDPQQLFDSRTFPKPPSRRHTHTKECTVIPWQRPATLYVEVLRVSL